MNYYLKELWEKINSSDVSERERAQSEWSKNDKLYQEYFEHVVKEKLSKKFLSALQNNHFLHDKKIKTIDFYTRNGTVELRLCVVLGNGRRFNIRFHDISECSVHYYEEMGEKGDLFCSYLEIYSLEDDSFLINMLCGFSLEIELKAKRIFCEYDKEKKRIRESGDG